MPWILILAVLIGFFYSDFTGESLITTLFREKAPASINDELKRSAEEHNRNLPRKFSNGHEWLSIQASNMQLTYIYKLVAPYPSSNILSHSVINDVCKDVHSYKLLKDEVKLQYVYLDENNNNLFKYLISFSSCS